MSFSFLFQNKASSGKWFSEEKNPVFDPEIIEKLKNENIYQYQESIDAPESLWDQFWNWVGRHLDRIFDALFNLGKPGWWATFVQLLPYLVIGLVIALLLYLFFKNNPLRKTIQAAKKNSDVLLHNLSPEERKSAIDELIEKAKKNNDYQLLIRYQYIKILNDLDRLKYIQFKSNKTNSEYYYELSTSNLLKDFKQLTYYYEYAWYGDFEVSLNLYKKYQISLQQINSQLEQKNG